ncbi:glycerophosphodiester phosphodiesterase [Chromatiales bacterium (ex Bugula neritina AB1)]|nr:glycerophosphodiester phosphodiesterase [Chromatiales bacterium (ex Bugula neritina AB1)]
MRRLRSRVTHTVGFAVLLLLTGSMAVASQSIELGARPGELINTLPQGSLRSKLESCAANPPGRSLFSIGHRGAPLKFPEHTRESYIAAAEMGAGIIECDVTFTADKTLVCRHSQCDLHTTTNILQTPLAAQCSTPPDFSSNTPFKNVKCCTSDITIAEFQTLRGKVDSGNKKAKTLQEYLSLSGTPKAALQGVTGTLMTHRESIELFRDLGVKVIPELKKPQVSMPFEGDFTQEQFAQALVDEYKNARIDPADVFLQSFNLNDVHYWLREEPEFGGQAAWLDSRYRDKSFSPANKETFTPSMAELAESGVKIIAPPLWMLLSLNDEKRIVPSVYAIEAKAAGLDIIVWTLERSGSLKNGGGWYYQSIKEAISNEGDIYAALDVLAQQVEIRGAFSDWPATTTYYANCMGIQ